MLPGQGASRRALGTEPRGPPVGDDEDDGCGRDAGAEAAGGVRVDSFDAADAVCRGPGARLARVGATLLCAGGVCREVPAAVASTLAGGDVIAVEDLAPEVSEITLSQDQSEGAFCPP